jgi:phospholipid/cholesterol/gamma-HCH transport system substrate-binding protein
VKRSRLALAVCLLLTLLPACSVVGGGGSTYRIVTYFPRAVSVFKSSDVRVLGLPAGKVTAIEIQGDRVKITLSMQTSIPVPANVHAQIVPLSLIGERYIQLSPAWHVGEAKATDGHVIGLENTIVPVEPDEALAALKDFLDSLDPKGLGKLVHNLATDLDGNGETLNGALSQLSDLVATFAEKDQTLLRIVDSFDKLTSTLLTREQQLGKVLDAFSTATQVLADERQSIERLLSGLATLSNDGLDLVSEHATALRKDIEVITRVTQAIDVNLDSVGKLLDSAPTLVKGILGAYNPVLRAINLRQSFSPLVANVLDPILGAIGIDPICVPVDVLCTGGPLGGLSSGDAVPALIAPTSAGTPIDSVLGLLAARTEAPPRRAAAPSMADRLAGFGGFVGDAAANLLGVRS